MWNTAEYPRPWYREPWPWILMAGPAAAIAAGAVTVWLAVASADGLVAGDYYRRGLAINQDVEPYRAAVERGIEADVVTAGGILRVRLKGAAPDALDACFVHPTRVGQDRRLRLARVAPGIYEGALPKLATGRWRLILEDPRGVWRIEKEQ